MRIYLLGFMGSGKTRLGKELAQLMHFSFIDLDQLIVKQEGRSINQIFETEGEAYFRILEKETLHKTSLYKDTIISTGGGTPCFYDNINWINAHGTSIFLDVNHEILCDRLWRGRQKRPLIKKLSRTELNPFIEEKILARLAFYTQAHVHYKILIEDQKSAAELSSFLKN